MRTLGFLSTGLSIVCAVAFGVAAPAHATTDAVEVATGAPQVIPALRQWTGGSGSAYQWTSASRLVVDQAAAGTLTSTASVFAADLQALTGTGPAQLQGTAVDARAGDIYLTVGTSGTPTQAESYALYVGSALTVAARTDNGVFNGTRTVLQLLNQARTIAAGTAVDWPTSPERGLSIDVGRKYFTIGWLQQRVKDLAWLKFNHLHLHLSDNEGFRLESSTVPGITAAEHYTKQQIADLVALAGSYHITVIPEIDMPAHLGAVLANPAYSRFALDPSGAYGNIDISNPDARALLRSLVQEYLPLFPGRYWALGGDEYTHNFGTYPRLQQYARTECQTPTATGLDSYYCFVNQMAALLAGAGKTTRIWNDGLTHETHVIPLDPSIAVDYWTGNGSNLQSPDEIAAKGNKVTNASWATTINGTFYTLLYYVLRRGLSRPATSALYDLWNVSMFDTSRTMSPAYSANLLGAQFNIWCDDPLFQNEDQIAGGMWADLRVVAQKTWGTAPATGSYTAFQALSSAVGSPVPLPASMRASRLAVTTNADGRLEAITVGGDGQVYDRWQTSPNGGWSSWTLFGGHDVRAVALGRNADGRLEALAVGGDGRVYDRWQRRPGSGWTDWADAGGTGVTSVAMTSNADGRLEALAIGGDGQVYDRWQTAPNSAWSGWILFGGHDVRSVAFARNADGRLEAIAAGGDSVIYDRWQTQAGGGWSSWITFGGSGVTAVTMTSNADGRLEALAIGGDGQTYDRWQTSANGGWSAWYGFGGHDIGSVALGRNGDGRLEALVLGGDGVYYGRHQYRPNSSWTGWLVW